MSNITIETESAHRSRETPDPMREVRYRFQPPRPARKTIPTTSLSMAPALPRITRLMALAIKLEGLRQQCPGLPGGIGTPGRRFAESHHADPEPAAFGSRHSRATVMAATVDPGPGSDLGKLPAAAGRRVALGAPARAVRGIAGPQGGRFRRSFGIR